MKAILTPKALMFIFTVMFFWVEVAEARLYRGGGRGTQQDQYSDTIYYVDNAYLNSVGITPDAHASYQWATDSNNRTGGFRGVEAVPAGDGECVKAVIADEQDAAYLEIEILENDLFYADDADKPAIQAQLVPLQASYSDLYANEPCVWEFEQGEDLFAWGSFDFFFDSPDVSYDVDWSIIGNNGSWGVSGSINTQSDLTDPNDPSKTIALGSVMLDSPAPLDLVAGDYSIDVQVTMSSLNGQFIMESLNHPDDAIRIEEVCKDNPEFTSWLADLQAAENVYNAWAAANLNPGVGHSDYNDWLVADNAQYAVIDALYDAEPIDNICGYNSIRNSVNATYEFTNRAYAESVYAPTSFYSFSETLRILPASQPDEVVNANTPATLSLFVIGIGGLLFRCRRQPKARVN